eukprot:1148766-Pelagomonas_calceolata.AAC.2
MRELVADVRERLRGVWNADTLAEQSSAAHLQPGQRSREALSKLVIKYEGSTYGKTEKITIKLAQYQSSSKRHENKMHQAMGICPTPAQDFDKPQGSNCLSGSYYNALGQKRGGYLRSAQGQGTANLSAHPGTLEANYKNNKGQIKAQGLLLLVHMAQHRCLDLHTLNLVLHISVQLPQLLQLLRLSIPVACTRHGEVPGSAKWITPHG